MLKPSTTRPLGLQNTVAFRDVAVTNSSDAKTLDTATRLVEYHRPGFIELFEDFNAPAGTTLPAWLDTQDTSTSGTPTIDYVANAAGGVFTLTFASTDEVETLTLYGGDHLPVTVQPGLIFECRIKLDAGTFPWSADQRLVCGLASARNATLDSVATHAWFRLEGNSANILWETDDGTTDDNDNDTGVDLADDTYVLLRIDVVALDDVRFYVDGLHCGTGDLTDASGDGVQVFIEAQKDAGTETDAVSVDYVRVVCPR